MTDAANLLVGNGDMSRSGITAMSTIADKQVSLHFDIAHLAQAGRDPGLAQDGIGCSNAISEVKLQLLHWQVFRDQIQGGVGGETGSVACEQVECRSVLRLVAVRRFQVQR